MDMSRVRAAQVDDAPAIARVSVASWRQTYRGIVPAAHLDALDEAERERNIRERLATIAAQAPSLACTFVAEARGQIVGFASAGAVRPMTTGAQPAGYASEIYALYTLPGRERHGLGGALTWAAASHLRAHGAASLIIWALAENPNRGFYAALGGVVVYEQTISIGGAELREVGFGWPDITTLIARTAAHAGADVIGEVNP